MPRMPLWLFAHVLMHPTICNARISVTYTGMAGEERPLDLRPSKACRTLFFVHLCVFLAEPNAPYPNTYPLSTS